MSATVWCTINIKLFHKRLKIAIIVVPVFKMFSVFCMKQIFTFGAGFIPGFVVWQIKAGNRTGTVEQMDANVEAMARDLQEILRIGAEQKRVWEVYEGR